MYLADNGQVAAALGKSESDLTPAQGLRLPGILAKLSGDFRYEAGREFTPGTTTVKLLTLAGRITLPDILNGVGENGEPIAGAVTSVQRWIDGADVAYTLVGQDVLVTSDDRFGSRRPGTGTPYVVTYTHNGAVPEDVSSAIAASAGRYLTVDPNSAVAQSTMLSAEGYHQRMAAWVSDNVKLDDGLTELAQRYRVLPVSIIAAKTGDVAPPSYETSFAEERW